MRKLVFATVGFVTLFAFSVGSTAGQELTPAQVHLGHLLERFPAAPDGQGLLTTAIAEARIAVQHATLGAQDPTNLQAMKLHAGHVRHAIDPAVTRNGPGLGFGLRPALDALIRHAELAARSQGATEATRTHSEHVVAAAERTLRRADQVLALAEIIADVDSAEDVAELYGDLKTLSDRILGGGTAADDETDGGIQYIERHVNLMRGSLTGR